MTNLCNLSENDLDDFLIMLADGGMAEQSFHNKCETLYNSNALHCVCRDNISNRYLLATSAGCEGSNNNCERCKCQGVDSNDSGNQSSVVPKNNWDDNCPIRNETIAISTFNISTPQLLHKELHPLLHCYKMQSSGLPPQRCDEANSSVMNTLLLSSHPQNDTHTSTLIPDESTTTNMTTCSKLTRFKTPSFLLTTSFTENEMNCIDTYLNCVCPPSRSISSTKWSSLSSPLSQVDTHMNPHPLHKNNTSIPSNHSEIMMRNTNNVSPQVVDDNNFNTQQDSPQPLHNELPLNTSSNTISESLEEERTSSPSCHIEIQIPHSSSPVKITKPKKLQRKKSISIAHPATPGASFVKENPWQFHTYVKGKRQHTNNLVFYHFNPKVSNIK
ncbi:hypothetical protein C9374_006792 [Naegleria lovaniensis]|uniref:Uncharacterized protein n=1 Tax=Naegleria lovaniensis TaxID=51637 RepID=A0AA88KRF9_NAELO|nr:uncharacterized protein C9374_006792 [Naegleria lovaniensis]KAG2393261.1 hypothetical protein C9374_006792 [Naegleria lovaniensis]